MDVKAAISALTHLDIDSDDDSNISPSESEYLYILIYNVYEYLRESLKGIISYIYIIIGIIINLIRYIFIHDISSCYLHIAPQNIRKTKQKYMKQW